MQVEDVSVGGELVRVDAHRFEEALAGNINGLRSVAAVAQEMGWSSQRLLPATRGDTSLPIHEARRLARILSMDLAHLVDDSQGGILAERRRRDQAEMRHWPVPLRPISSWLGLGHLADCSGMLVMDCPDDALELEHHAAAENMFSVLEEVCTSSNLSPLRAGAILKDQARSLDDTGLNLCFGTFVARYRNVTNIVIAVPALVVSLRRETAMPDFTLGRTAEPEELSVGEFEGDVTYLRALLEWEDKSRLMLW